MKDFFLLSLQCVIVAFVYSEILIKPGEILHPFFVWLTRKLTTNTEELIPDNAPPEVMNLPQYQSKPILKIVPVQHWLLRPLGGCSCCTAGQLALWSYVFYYLVIPFMNVYVVSALGFVVWGVAIICNSIFLMYLLIKINERWSMK